MHRPLPMRLPLRIAFALAASAGVAAAQESVIFSLSSSGTAGFGPLADTEIAIWEPSTGATRPWLMTPTSAFFGGDVDGDGKSDEWKDVDALYVHQQGNRVDEVLVSFNTSFGAFADGDVVRLAPDGTLAAAYTEAQLVAAFGLANGMDLDGLHVGPDGRIYVSFADDEPSSLLSTDLSGVITDGSIVWWDTVNQVVGIEITEGQVDSLVSHALGKPATTTDTLGIAMDRNGVISFSVQSPSGDDASVFSEANGGEYVRREADLGLTGSPEIDALDLQTAPIAFLTARVPLRVIPANTVATVDVDGPAPLHTFALLLDFQRGDTSRFPLNGLGGLALDPSDPMFVIALAGMPWIWGFTDAAGHGTIVFPAPVGITVTVLGQPYDFDARVCGTPIALEFEG